MSLVIITPSYINSGDRLRHAEKSLHSLQGAIGTDFLHIVVNDIPRHPGKGIFKSLELPDFNFYRQAKTVYNQPNICLIHRLGKGSVSATLRAVKEAKKRSASLVFIHLDDNVYISKLKEIFQHSCDAFIQDPGLMEIRATGYPILSRACTPELGNCSQIQISEDEICFDQVRLHPVRRKDYTLWQTLYHADIMDGQYWALPMWSTIYRVEFLEKLLTFDVVPTMKRLGEVELYYKNKDNWQTALQHFSGKLGYINMQFGGLEMHRNKNWQELISLPNTAVR